jgi:hypothetical protein
MLMKTNNLKNSVFEILGSEIKTLREEGFSLEYIGKKEGVTRERIRQVINKYYPGIKPVSFSESKAANILGITTEILRKRRIQGLIHPVKIGQTYRYDEKTTEAARLLLNKSCRICGEPVPPGNIKLCKTCSIIMRNPKSRLSLPGEKERHGIYMKHWKENSSIDKDTNKHYNSAKM